MSKYRVGEKSKNDNRVYSFIWHFGVGQKLTFSSSFLGELKTLKFPFEINWPLRSPSLNQSDYGTWNLFSNVFNVLNFFMWTLEN